MKIDRATIHKIAHLARLEFDAEAEEALAQNMTEILDWVDQLNEVDTSDVEPMTNMTMEVNHFRPDKVGQHLDRKEALDNAPKKDDQYFRVPKVLGAGD